MYETVLLGTDGSEGASRAVNRAIRLCKNTGADLHAVTIVNTRRYGEPALSSTELVLNELEDRGFEQLQEIRDRAKEDDIEVVTECFHGDPSEEILAYADEIDADVIILGYQGRTHPRSDIGSTADRVTRETNRSVLLV